MVNDPKKGWLFLAINKQIAMILLALVEEKIRSRRYSKAAKNDLNVLQIMLLEILGRHFVFKDSEES
tara:strand:+ start:2347 stop:2547 length:201 start_codon:yes stop_codon:yes gene_type:complete